MYARRTKQFGSSPWSCSALLPFFPRASILFRVLRQPNLKWRARRAREPLLDPSDTLEAHSGSFNTPRTEQIKGFPRCLAGRSCRVARWLSFLRPLTLVSLRPSLPPCLYLVYSIKEWQIPIPQPCRARYRSDLASLSFPRLYASRDKGKEITG